MTSITSLVNQYSLQNSLLNESSNEDSNESLSAKLRKDIEAKAEQSKQQAISPGRKLLQAATEASRALEGLREKGIPIKSGDIAEEASRMESDYQLKIKVALKALGVDEDIEFKLGLDKSGKVVVNAEHADKDTVQAFFDANPELSEELKDIEALKNLQKTMTNNSKGMSAVDIKRSIQLENMNAFYSGLNGDDSYSSLIMSYTKNSISALAGINVKV